MPLYEYRCGHCGERFEKLISISAASSSVNCPVCDQQQAERLISQVATIGGESCGPAAASGGGGG